MTQAPFLRLRARGARTDLSHPQFWATAAGLEQAVRDAAAPGGMVLVLGHTSAPAMALFIAIVAAGRVAAWFPPNAPRQDRASYFTHQRAAIAHAQPCALFVDDAALLQTIASIDPLLASKSFVIGDGPRADWRADGAADWRADGAADGAACRARFLAACNSPDTILVQHSSGTTGLKKPVAITGRMLRAQFDSYWPLMRRAGGGGKLRIASWLPLYHDMGLMAGFLLPLLGGDCLSLLDPFDWIEQPESLFEMIEQDESCLCWMPNFAFRHLLRLKPAFAPRRLGSVRAWIDCSETCRLAEAADFEAAFAGWGVWRPSAWRTREPAARAWWWLPKPMGLYRRLIYAEPSRAQSRIFSWCSRPTCGWWRNAGW